MEYSTVDRPLYLAVEFSINAVIAPLSHNRDVHNVVSGPVVDPEFGNLRRLMGQCSKERDSHRSWASFDRRKHAPERAGVPVTTGLLCVFRTVIRIDFTTPLLAAADNCSGLG